MGRKPDERRDKRAGAEREPEVVASESEVIAEELARLESEDAARAQAEQAAGAAIEEPPEEKAQRLEREVSEWKDRALRASADFDNFRKRAFRERDEASGRGAAEAFGRILDVIDDLARVAHLDPAQTSTEALHEGMLAIERKFLKTLELAGVERIDPAGQPFDPQTQEAVAALPAPDAASDHTVGAVYQHGYRYRGQLLRPARVAVLQWSGPAAPPGGDAAS